MSMTRGPSVPARTGNSQAVPEPQSASLMTSVVVELSAVMAHLAFPATIIQPSNEPRRRRFLLLPSLNSAGGGKRRTGSSWPRGKAACAAPIDVPLGGFNAHEQNTAIAFRRAAG
jgi:hypothetical protein